MTYEEELIFGLQRWIVKAINYYDNRKFDDFLQDEKSFDATSYCFEVVNEIANEIIKKKEIMEKYKEVDFTILAILKLKIYVGDNINLDEYQDYIERIFPLTISTLVVK